MFWCKNKVPHRHVRIVFSLITNKRFCPRQKTIGQFKNLATTQYTRDDKGLKFCIKVDQHGPVIPIVTSFQAISSINYGR